MDLYAWIGEDKYGSGRIGLKQGNVPAGYIPLVVMDYDREKIEALAPQMQMQARIWGKTIRLAKFTFVGDVMVVGEPS